LHFWFLCYRTTNYWKCALNSYPTPRHAITA